MKQVSRLTEAELDIMQVLWAQDGPIRPAQLLPLMCPTHEWSISTLQTLLDRLRIKGATAFKREKRFRYYYPAVTREEYVEAVTQTMINRICDESAAAVIIGLMQNNSFSEADVESIREAAELLSADR